MDDKEALSAPAPQRFPRETLSAWLFLLLGYFFCCVFPMSKRPLAAVLYLAALYAVTFLVLLRGRVRFGLVQKLVLFSAVLALIAPLLWDNTGDAFLCFLYVLMAYAYLIYAASGNTLEEGLSALVGADLVRALFAFPFSSFGKLFHSLALRDGKGIGKLLLKILLGLLLAALPTAAALSLLSFDSGFRSIVDGLFSFRREDLGIQIARLLFAVPVSMYLYGMFYSSRTKSAARDEAAKLAREHAEQFRFIPLVTAAAAVIPLLSVYIIFFISQWKIYTSAFTGVLPAALSYAEYAREGFFQLCAVSCINFIVLICLSCLVRREKEKLRRALALLLALFSLVLIATAFSKLLLYIARYDLTPDRLYAAWFMLLFTVLFTVVILSQFFPRLKALPLCLAVTVALYLLLALSGPNGRIARYNVERYLSGETKRIDVELLVSLGDDAIPSLLRLDEYWAENGNAPDKSAHAELQLALSSRAAWETDFWRRTYSSRRADRLLSDAGY